MKKVMMTVLVAVLFTAAVAVGPAWSQGKPNFSLNLGVQTDIFNGTSFDKALFTVDARAGFLLGRNFEISPEVMAVFNYDYFALGLNSWLLNPGVMLNYKAGAFFVGAGAVLPIMFWSGAGDSGSDSGRVSPKINIGYIYGNFQVTAYLTAWTGEGIDFLDVNWAGITLGYRF